MLACGAVAGLWSLAVVSGAAAAPAVAPAAIAVRGDSRCPTPAEVSAALIGLLPAAPSAASPDIVELSGQHSASASVRLTNAQGQVLAEKRLPDALSCGERARAAAVIVAAWEARFAPAPPADTATVAPPPFKTPPPAPAASASLTSPRPAPAPARLLQVDVGAAVLGSVTAGALAPGLVLDARLGRAGSRFALGLGAIAVSTHEVSIGTARGSWRRYGGSIDARAGARAGAVDLEIRAGAVLTSLVVTGEALPVTSGATIFDPGALVGLRARWRAGALAPWVEAAAVDWPRTHDLYVRGTALVAQVPAFENWLLVGFSLGAER